MLKNTGSLRMQKKWLKENSTAHRFVIKQDREVSFCQKGTLLLCLTCQLEALYHRGRYVTR